jgi:2-oxoglutarate dehydrogenase E1 component
MDVASDPLGSPPPGAPELSPEFHHVSEAELATVPGAALGLPDATAADAVARLRTLYCSTMGFEFEHLQTATERQWLRKAVEGGSYNQPLTADEQKSILRRLTEVDALERFLGRAYQGYKRFSVEGSDALVVMLDEVIALAALNGATDVGIAMAHRGRINVLAHTMGMPYGKIFEEFHGKQASTETTNASGDVKYHLGYNGSREIGGHPQQFDGPRSSRRDAAQRLD